MVAPASIENPAGSRMVDAFAHRRPRRPGDALARLSAALLGIDVLLLVFLLTALAVHAAAGSLHDFLTRPGFPLLLYAVWGLGVFGSAGAICAITVYGYRERWFWRWLVVASAAWLTLPPVHTVIGLVALAALIHHRSSFVTEPSAAAAPL